MRSHFGKISRFRAKNLAKSANNQRTQDESKRDRRGTHRKNDQRRRPQANPARARVLRRRRVRRSLEPKRHARRASEHG